MKLYFVFEAIILEKLEMTNEILSEKCDVKSKKLSLRKEVKNYE